MIWILPNQLTRPGMYLVRLKTELIGNSTLRNVNADSTGWCFWSERAHERAYFNKMKEQPLLFGPIPYV